MIKEIFEELKKDYRKICKSVPKKITEELISKIPNNPGIYIFYENRKIRYVGRANNLRTRINQSHLSKSNRVANSPFRKKLSNEKKVSLENMRDYIMKNFEIFYLVFDKSEKAYDYTLLLEAFLIMQWRGRNKHNLLNNNYDLGK